MWAMGPGKGNLGNAANFSLPQGLQSNRSGQCRTIVSVGYVSVVYTLVDL